jgi:ABC-type nitrate/sulfonate/bicarbonate transport system permease component
MSTGRRRGRRIIESEAVRPLLLIVAVLSLWQAAVTGFRIAKYLVPAPTAVVVAIELIEKWLIPWDVSQRTSVSATP